MALIQRKLGRLMALGKPLTQEIFIKGGSTAGPFGSPEMEARILREKGKRTGVTLYFFLLLLFLSTFYFRFKT